MSAPVTGPYRRHRGLDRSVLTFEVMRTFFGLLSLAANAATLAVVAWMVAGRPQLVAGVAPGRFLREHGITLSWVVATTATLGSLYLSEIVHLVPCILCWYQRIAMYPLILLLGVLRFRSDRPLIDGFRYVLPVAAVGWLLAAYHFTIQQLPDLSVGVCSTGVPCTAPYMRVFGFMTIPYMAASAFALIAVITVATHERTRQLQE